MFLFCYTYWNADALLIYYNDIDLAVNTGKTKYMDVGRHRGKWAYQDRWKSENHNYLGSLLTSQNSIHEERKCRLKAGNSSYYSVQTLLSSRLHFMNFKIKIFKIIFPDVLYRYATCSPTSREECRLVLFKNRILSKENGDWSRIQDEELCSLYLHII